MSEHVFNVSLQYIAARRFSKESSEVRSGIVHQSCQSLQSMCFMHDWHSACEVRKPLCFMGELKATFLPSLHTEVTAELKGNQTLNSAATVHPL